MKCDGPISSVVCVPELSAVVVGDTSGALTVFDLQSGAIRQRILCDASVTCVACAPQLRAVISGESSMAKEHHRVTVWDMDTGAKRTEMWYKSMIAALEYVPELHVVVSGDGGYTDSHKGGQVVTWDIDSIEKFLRLPCPGAVISLACASDGERQLLAAGDRSGTVTCWDAKSGDRRFQIGIAEGTEDDGRMLLPQSLAYAEQLEALLCGESYFKGMIGFLSVLDIKSGTWRFRLQCDGPVMAVAHSPSSSALVSGDRAGKVIVWDAASRERRTESSIGNPVNAVSYDASINAAVAGDKQGKVVVLRLS